MFFMIYVAKSGGGVRSRLTRDFTNYDRLMFLDGGKVKFAGNLVQV